MVVGFTGNKCDGGKFLLVTNAMVINFTGNKCDGGRFYWQQV
jgi:ribosomal protein L13